MRARASEPPEQAASRRVNPEARGIQMCWIMAYQCRLLALPVGPLQPRCSHATICSGHASAQWLPPPYLLVHQVACEARRVGALVEPCKNGVHFALHVDLLLVKFPQHGLGLLYRPSAAHGAADIKMILSWATGPVFPGRAAPSRTCTPREAESDLVLRVTDCSRT